MICEPRRLAVEAESRVLQIIEYHFIEKFAACTGPLQVESKSECCGATGTAVCRGGAAGRGAGPGCHVVRSLQSRWG